MVFQGIIFDLDGTLADTLSDLANSMNRVLSAHALPVHLTPEYKYFVGRGLRNLVRSALPAENRSDRFIDDCLTELKQDYKQNCLLETRLYPGMEKALRQIQEKNIRMAVFSNKDEAMTRQIVQALLPGLPFVAVIGAKPELPAKPDPEGALLISELMKIAPGNIAYLGDTDVDMITANRAGMFALGALWGFRTGSELRENGARVLLEKPGDLAGIIIQDGD